MALENWTIERTLTALLTDRLVLYHYTYSTTTIERFSIHTVLLHSSFFLSPFCPSFLYPCLHSYRREQLLSSCPSFQENLKTNRLRYFISLFFISLGGKKSGSCVVVQHEQKKIIVTTMTNNTSIIH